MSNRGLVILLVVLVAILLLVPGFGFGMLGPGMMRPGVVGGFGRGFLGGVPGWQVGLALALSGLARLVFFGAVIAGIVLLVRWAGGRDHEDGRTPQDILRRRFASGELTADQYDQMRRTLES